MEKHRCMGCMDITENEICEKCGWKNGGTNEPHQLPVGYRLHEQYVIGRVLGQGGFGITYLGWDDNLDMPVAVKEFYPNTMVNRESAMTTKVHCYTEQVSAQYIMSKERFLREAKALARFEYEPAIVRIMNFFQENDTAYIVMEYIRGTTLAAYINLRGGKLKPEETLRILKPVMEALAAVHEAELVHRDISPDNIILHPRGGAKLLDFGAVRSVEGAEAGKDMLKSTEAILKHGFAPMEQYQSRGGLGPWTDEYALCATIYYCLTGRIPEEAPLRMMEDIRIDWEIPGLTDRQKAALRKGFSIRARDRFGSIRELARELYETEEKPAPGPDPVPVTGKKPAGRKAVPKTEKKRPEKKQPQKTGDTSGGKRKIKPSSSPKKPRKKKYLLLKLLLAATALLILLAVLPNGWRITDSGYSYYSMGFRLANRWHQENGCWYHFNEKGIMDTGWVSVDGVPYYFGADGIRVTGWLQLDGKTYYMGTDGVQVNGLRTVDGNTYFFGPEGAVKNRWQEVDGMLRYFGEDGAVQTGWLQLESETYYLGSDGTMKTGWMNLDGKTYYLGSDGVLRTEMQTIDGKTYYFNVEGVLQTGWVFTNNEWYNFDSYGVMRTGWVTFNGNRYYLYPDGKMAKGWLDVDGNRYYLGSDGIMRLGWQEIYGNTYYFGQKGTMHTGWYEDNRGWFYFGEDGKMAEGRRLVDGRWYNFTSSGIQR